MGSLTAKLISVPFCVHHFHELLEYAYLPRSVSPACYLCRGAPDILQNQCIITGGDPDVENSGDAALENSHQRQPLKGCSPFVHLDKLGELIAALHFLLVSKFLLKGKSTAVLEVRGTFSG